MFKKGFTLVELLAVIVILAIILAIAVPGISGTIKGATKASFKSDAKMVLKGIDYRLLNDDTFDVTTVTNDTINSLLGLSNENYDSVAVAAEDGTITIDIVGKGKWRGLVACGTYENMQVVESSGECISDIRPPIITVLGDNPVTVQAGSVYTDAGAVASDNKDGNLTSSIVATGTVNLNASGTYVITYRVSDNAGNEAVESRTINVIDDQAPVITLLGATAITISQGSIYSDAGATAYDAADGNITSSIVTTGTINVNAIGTYTITYNVRDNSGNAAITVTRTIIVVSSEYNLLKGVNKPSLVAGMTPVKWDGSTWVSTTPDDTDWYDYNNKKWANVKTADGSMWVWIPRYIYKISSGWHSNNTGTIDAQFSRGIDDNWNNLSIGNVDTGLTSNSSNNKWTNHPAFTFGNVQLTGIWIAKFEATAKEGVANGYTSDASCLITGDNVSTKTIQVLPNVSSWRCVNIGNMFTDIRSMETNSTYGWGTSGTGMDTHLMKNTEWGAVAYLSKSNYGQGTNEIWINNSQTFTTGCAGTATLSGTYNGCQSTYDSTDGEHASTTGNIYGIYDMAGGAWEYVAAYVNNGNANLAVQGASIINAASQYKNVYAVGTTDDQTANYGLTINQKGDAIYETSKNVNASYSWFNDYSYMPYDTCPWFKRGGALTSGAGMGAFSLYYVHGGAVGNVGFRPVVAVNSGL